MENYKPRKRPKPHFKLGHDKSGHVAPYFKKLDRLMKKIEKSVDKAEAEKEGA